MIFTLKPENELEKDGRKKAPLYGEEEIVCPNCHRTLKISQAESAMMTCICSHHFRIGARKRIGYMTDSFTELFGDIRQRDPLSFPGYGDKLEKARKQSGEEDSAITGTAIICGMKCALFAMDPFFMMGSMGTVTGEKIASLFEYATENDLPVIGFTASGGARMQEGLLYITVLTDPTTGGVTASFAMEGDIIIAEPRATVAFAGRRVIEETTKEELPKGFQTSEFLLEHGFVDIITDRKDEKKLLASLLRLHGGEK